MRQAEGLVRQGTTLHILSGFGEFPDAWEVRWIRLDQICPAPVSGMPLQMRKLGLERLSDLAKGSQEQN